MASDSGVTAAHAARHSEVGRHMTIGAILSGLALFSVAFECHVAAAVFLALALYLIGHGA